MLLPIVLCCLLRTTRADPATTKANQMANQHLEAVSRAKLLTTNVQSASLKTILAGIDIENAAAITKYKTAVKTIQTDLAGAVKRLDLFSRNVTLLALKESHSEGFTKAYYALTNRNQADQDAINDAFQQLRTGVKDVLQTASDRYFEEVQQTAESLAAVTRARGTFAEKCNTAIGAKITGSFAPLQREIDTCLTRERLRLTRISDSVDRVVQLLRLNMAEFAADIISCTRFALFASNNADYYQTKGCLEANLLEMEHYGGMIDAELDQLRPTVQLETEASNVRIRHCVMQSAGEASALMEGTRTTINRCAEVGP